MPMESEKNLHTTKKELKGKRRNDIVCCGISEFVSLIFASMMIQSQKFSSVYFIPSGKHFLKP